MPALICYLASEMAPVFKAQHLHDVIGKTQAKIAIFHITVAQREVPDAALHLLKGSIFLLWLLK